MEIGKRSAVHSPAPRRPEAARPAPVATPQYSHSQPTPKPSGNKRKKLVVGLVVLLLLAACAFSVWKFGGKSGLVGIDSGKYQAVFLSNGQVYFGKLYDSSNYQVKITNIYYLQEQKLQSGEKEEDTSNKQVSLAKLGDELHGPQDEMFISKDQILFWENLKDDSKVVSAIKSDNR